MLYYIHDHVVKTRQISDLIEQEILHKLYPRANGAKRRFGRNAGVRVTNSALAELKVVAHGSKGVGMS